MILARHCILGGFKAAPGTMLAYFGRLSEPMWMGVDFFFVLSGFLIARGILQNRHAGNFARVFYVRRACRILPLYALLLLGWKLAIDLVGPVTDHSWQQHMLGTVRNPFFVLSFTQNFVVASSSFDAIGHWLAPTWSICVEEHFYLLAPLLLRRVRSTGLASWGLSLAALLVVARMGLAWARPELPRSFFYTTTYLRLDGLLFGVALAAAEASPRAARVFRGRKMPLFLVVALVVCWSWQYLPESWNNVRVLRRGLDYLLPALLAAATVGVLRARPDLALTRVLKLQPLRWLGTRSYCLYLVHVPMLCVIHGVSFGRIPKILDLPSFGASVAAIGCSLVLAELSWRLLELPLLSWAHGVRYESEIPDRDSDYAAPARAG